MISMAVQVNGKVRGHIQIPRAATENEVKEIALAAQGVVQYTAGKAIKKFIYVPGKIVNVVVA